MSDDDSKVPLPELDGSSEMQTVADAGALAPAESDSFTRGASDLEALFDVPVKVSAVLELDRKVGEAIDIYVNDRLVARGEVVLVEDKLGVTMTEIIKSEQN